MPFIPHTEDDVRAMLAAIGVKDIDELFDEIPAGLRVDGLPGEIPVGENEMEVTRTMHARAREDQHQLCFAGAGAYDHHVPAAVWQIATRGEFYSAYTPYQAEASQGTLQLLYEYQTMMSGLMDMEVSNASLYDGASALAEAVLMAVRANRKAKSKRIYMPRTVHPVYRKVVRTIVTHQGIELVELDYDRKGGHIDPDSLPESPGDAAALVIPQPNFFGVLEEVDALTDWAHGHGMLVIAVVNPLVMSVIRPPGRWGKDGADIACGEGQPLGVPLASGGPYFGFMCCRQAHVRQMPGRIVGRTVDIEGRSGYTLTLQAREQHIRRSKATSNICTNQGLLVTAATIHMALLGPAGLEAAALASHRHTRELLQQLESVAGVSAVFERPVFHEAVVQLPLSVSDILRPLSVQGIVGGVSLAGDYPELGNALLVCATEKRGSGDIASFAENLQRIFVRLNAPACPVAPKL
ncbi:MAG TPA: aminomethyl-transferring glycine dehydrogenase subunit GcvPA [Gammaproteobacteria bacterium]|nr:aminomethyl-transferring glycine dehydrogenase subunit GcvPA [Gammaproteobacteria bacterium]